MGKTLGIGGPLIPGICHIGNRGGGVLAENIPSSGTSGPGYVFPSLVMPSDAGKEIMGRITYKPPGLNFSPNEDTSGLATAADGTYVCQMQLYVNYIAVGPAVPITFTFGNGALVISIGWVEGADIALIAAVVGGGVVGGLSWTEGSDGVALTAVVSQTVTALIGWTEAPDGVTILANVAVTDFTFDPDCIVTIEAQDCIVEV